MAGTSKGALKARDTLLKKNPNFFKEIGKIGGSSGRHGYKGFAQHRDLAVELGAKGGRISKRTKKNDKVESL